MPEEHHLTARNLLEQMNRQFNECNALYHELAVHYGVSNTVFWLLYTPVSYTHLTLPTN